jgi:hypothetical protein
VISNRDLMTLAFVRSRSAVRACLTVRPFAPLQVMDINGEELTLINDAGETHTIGFPPDDDLSKKIKEAVEAGDKVCVRCLRSHDLNTLL